jgi:hypothetical protein
MSSSLIFKKFSQKKTTYQIKLTFTFLLLISLLGSCNTNAATPKNNQAFLIGISQYAEINSLHYADSDVNSFNYFLVNFSDFLPNNIHKLVNQQATKSRIADEFKKIIRDSEKKPIDQFIFVYAGHGHENQYKGQETNIFLAPYDASYGENSFNITDKEAINDTFINKVWLAKQLAAIKAKSIIVILDSCYSGTKDFGNLFASNLNVEVKYFDSTKRLPSSDIVNITQEKEPLKQFAYIASSKDNQKSAEYDELKHGALSYCMFEYFKQLQKSTNEGQYVNLKIQNLYDNIVSLFASVRVDGIPLNATHQPLLLSMNGEVKDNFDMDFIRILGLNKVLPEQVNKNGYLKIDIKESDYELSVDGSIRNDVKDNLISLSEGKHLVEVFISKLSYRFSFVVEIQAQKTFVQQVETDGQLEILTFFDDKGTKKEGPNIEIYIDNMLFANAQSFKSKLSVGTHKLLVKFKDVTQERQIEIRPDSPLIIKYNIILQAAKQPSEKEKSVGNVVF